MASDIVKFFFLVTHFSWFFCVMKNSVTEETSTISEEQSKEDIERITKKSSENFLLFEENVPKSLKKLIDTNVKEDVKVRKKVKYNLWRNGVKQKNLLLLFLWNKFKNSPLIELYFEHILTWIIYDSSYKISSLDFKMWVLIWIMLNGYVRCFGKIFFSNLLKLKVSLMSRIVTNPSEGNYYLGDQF